MNNLKTAVIVVLLLGALYGAYQFLNQRDVPPPPEVLAQEQLGIAPPTIEFGTPGFEAGPMPIPAGDSFAAPTFAPPGELTPPSPTPPAAIDTPSFAVVPDVAAPSKFTPPAIGTPRQESTPRAVDVTFHEPAATPAVAPSAYTDSAVRAEAPPSTAAAPSNDPFPGLQANPFYRANGAKPAAAPVAAGNAIARQSFERSWSEASRLVESGKFKEALAELTVFYDSPDLTAAESKQLLRTLDSLAGRVIYSTEHYLADEYVVRVDETLMDVAAKFNVPYQLLQNINGIRDPLVLSPKSKLKVVPGPFRAD
ncbi:MAG TPA: LysM peptidoglycan-binding domain-containing protein, partial [Pirellulaceae bacterium]|nr:LysM peptidoglycan-binding domain-containing protein [Pirellulaceae bacterium]